MKKLFRNWRNIAFNSLVCVLVVAVIFGLVAPDVIGFVTDTWYARLQRWQTLIAGILAVVAAYFTVRQMRIADCLADQRHSELIALNLRSEALKIERGCEAALAGLQPATDKANGILEQFRIPPPDQREKEVFDVYVSGVAADILAVVREIKVCLGRTEFTEITDILDLSSYTTNKIVFLGCQTFITEWATNIRVLTDHNDKVGQPRKEPITQTVDPSDYIEQWIEKDHDRMINDFSELIDETTYLCSCLVRLMNKYDVKNNGIGRSQNFDT